MSPIDAEAERIRTEIERRNREEPDWMNRIIEAVNKKLSPNSDGSCTVEGCEGRAVRRVTGRGLGRIYYRVQCNACQKVYLPDNPNMYPVDRRSARDFKQTVRQRADA
jgi:hypothetical protein